MSKLYLTSCLTFLVLVSVGQKNIPVSESITISGVVEKEITIGFAEILALKSKPIADVLITNHTGEARSTAKGMKGILIKDLLATVPFKAESPKVLSEFYLAFISTDGYTAVFSWNELFNSPTGDNSYLIVEKEGEKLAEMPERILVMTPTDLRTGRRNIKGLNRIVVGRYTKS